MAKTADCDPARGEEYTNLENPAGRGKKAPMTLGAGVVLHAHPAMAFLLCRGKAVALVDFHGARAANRAAA